MATLEDLERRMEELNDDITECKTSIATLTAKVEMLIESNKSMETIMKYVVTPLIIIVGALVGVKLVLP